MNKDFSQAKLIEMSVEKKIKVLLDLALFIENNCHTFESSHFQKLAKYHRYLKDESSPHIQKLNKEFNKIHRIDYQFQIYLMNLERLLGHSSSEYHFLVDTDDETNLNVKKFPVVCLLDSIRSAHNVGAMIRNSECFGNTEIVLSGLTPKLENPSVQKTVMNSDEYINCRYVEDAKQEVKSFKEKGFQVWSIETTKDAKPINEVNNIDFPLLLVFGHEQFGISKDLLELSDLVVRIPLYGQKNSLNVAVSQAVVLHQVISKI